jgi:hypothetical protein
MVVQYKAGTRYLCNYLRQQYRVPVCQYLPADPVDAKVVAAFFAALSSVELDAYQRALAAQQQTETASERPVPSSCNACAIRRRWPNGSSSTSIPPTAWWRQS